MIRPRTPPDQAAVARHYDEVDPFYRGLWSEHLHHGLFETGREDVDEAVRALVERVAEAAGLDWSDQRSNQDVIDIGCGYGATARMLAERWGARVTGVTLSPAQHAVAEDRTAHLPDVCIVLGDWQMNTLPAMAFDAAIAIESTEHMADKPRVFGEAYRVLRPGGRLAVCAWLASPAAGRVTRDRLLRPICEEGRLAALDTAADYGNWIRSAGFVDVSHEDLTERVSRTWRLCAARMLGSLKTLKAWRYLLDGRKSERRFALTVMRILVAYRVGALRYGLFRGRRES